MKRNFTYKEYTLIAGILVAVVVVLTFWFRQEPVIGSTQTFKPKNMSIPEVAKALVRRAVAEIRF